MLSKKYLSLSLAILSTILFVGFIILTKNIDVKEFYLDNKIGFYSINTYIDNISNHKQFFNIVSTIIEILCILVMVTFFIFGVIELIQRKNVFKVDKEILSLGVFYAILFLFYIGFELLEINMKYTIDDELKSSFPSSHTLLSIGVLFSFLIISKDKLNNKYYKLAIIIAISFSILMVITRTLSGMHWFSDIVGSVILGFSLLEYFKFVYCNYVKES